jgi:hypothetical protein
MWGMVAERYGDAVAGPSIVAVLAAGAPELDQAVDRQSRAPDAVVRARCVLSDGIAGALAQGAQWLWLLDGSALPRPDALERLAGRTVAAGLPAPVLLASRVVDAAGVAAPGHAPWPRRMVTELTLRSAVERLLPLRAARAGSLLVRAEAIRGPAADLAGPGAALEWTGRLLREGMGYLVSDSLADAATDAPWEAGATGRDPAEDLRVAAAMLAGGGWSGRERVALAAEAAGRAAAALRERPGRAPALLRAAAGGIGSRSRDAAGGVGSRSRDAAGA